MDKPTISVYDSVAARWVEKYNTLVAKLLQELAMRYFHKERSTLEIGCGSGRDLGFLNGSGFPTVGMDASEGLLNECRKHSPNYEYIFDSLPLLKKIEDSSFHNIYSSAVIMHLSVEDIALALKNISRVMKDNGVFVFSYRESSESNEREKDGRLFTEIKFDFIARELCKVELEVLFYQSEDSFWHHFAVRKLHGRS